MKHGIAVKWNGHSREEVTEICQSIELQAEVIEGKSSGLAMDPATVAILVEVAKVTLPALLSAIAAVWAARISTKNKGRLQTQDYFRN